MNWGRRTINKVVSRQKHDSLIAAGAGGRSSFSGQAATVFGSTGFVGHSLVNNLGRIGSSVVLPIRGTTERHQGKMSASSLGDSNSIFSTRHAHYGRSWSTPICPRIRYGKME